jgi:peptide chain release factor 2
MDGSSILPFGSIWKTSKGKSQNTSSAFRLWRTVFDAKTKQKRIQEVEKLLEDPEVWQDREQGIALSQELADAKRELALFDSLQEKISDMRELAGVLKEEDAGELQVQLNSLGQALEKAESQRFLSGKYDKGNAILTITAGAGGQDAQDWATMLYRMYERYAQGQGWQTKELSHSFGEGGGPEGRVGTKQVSFEAQGKYAYGFLKYETGVHRLVRMSPFSAKQLRHTSFASLEVLPVIDRMKEKDIEISPEDITLDTFRSSGPGGQNVNKRESAVRITHKPTGLVVACQSQRSQQQNVEKALEMLAAKLYYRKKEEEEKELTKLKGEKKSIEWGSQVRSYVLAPYQLVKDHRTGLENSRVDAVLDGELQDFVEAELKAHGTH